MNDNFFSSSEHFFLLIEKLIWVFMYVFRYHVHEKIVNFMAPLPMTVPPMAPKLFENLFGRGNQ